MTKKAKNKTEILITENPEQFRGLIKKITEDEIKKTYDQTQKVYDDNLLTISNELTASIVITRFFEYMADQFCQYYLA